MKPRWQSIQNIYLSLTLFNTLATSLIWGINTLFLLSAGLNNTQAFLANAFFMLGHVLFEVPTGIVADIKGRRLSYILGTLTLAAATLLYFVAWQIGAPFWLWAVSSVLLAIGYTFFSGATEAWLVDALAFAGHKGDLESVFAKRQIVDGAAMLVGAVGGGLIAQATNLGVPYLLRAFFLVVNFVVAFLFMKDWGFVAEKSASLAKDVKQLFGTSFRLGLQHPPVRWIMLTSLFTGGVGMYVFYAMQPHLLNLFGDQQAYWVAGLAAALMAGTQIIGGLTVPFVRVLFKRRTTVLILRRVIAAVALIILSLTSHFWLALVLLFIWGLASAVGQPVRQAYLNKLIPSRQRATVLSFDALLDSAGGAATQPLLGRSADIWGYPVSFIFSALVQTIALPLILLARKEKSEADKISN
jgi:MFS family permease